MERAKGKRRDDRRLGLEDLAEALGLPSAHDAPDVELRELEIGSGDGRILIELARAQPLVQFLGLEVARQPFRAAIAAARGTPNCRFLQVDATEYLNRPTSARYRCIHIYFPTPIAYPATGATRYFTGQFFDRLLQLLAPGGEIRVISDRHDLANAAMRFAQARRCLLVPWTPLPLRPPEGYYIGSAWERRVDGIDRPIALRIVP